MNSLGVFSLLAYAFIISIAVMATCVGNFHIKMAKVDYMLCSVVWILVGIFFIKYAIGVN
jgi:hypothetical protein